MKREEKVMAEWTPELRDDAQPLEELPRDMDTDYVVLRFQGSDVNRRYATKVKQFAIDLSKRHPGEFSLGVITVTQQQNRFLPKNSWTLVRGIFDYMMNWSKDRARDHANEKARRSEVARNRRERAAR